MSVGKWKCVRCSGPVEEVDGKTQDCPECGLCPQCCECAGIVWGDNRRAGTTLSERTTLKVMVNGSQIELPAEVFLRASTVPPSWHEVITVGPGVWDASPEERQLIYQLLGVTKRG